MQKIQQQISLLTIIFTMIIISQIFTTSLKDKIAKIESDKTELSVKINDYYIPQQVEFEGTLKRITQYISETDSFMGVGGTWGKSPEYFDSVIFDGILKAQNTNDFDLFLANTENYFNERTKYFDALPSIWPLEYSPRLRITSGFGERFSPFNGKLQMHSGVDLVSVWKAKIIATSPGKIVEYWPPTGSKGPKGVIYKGHPLFGGYIIIEHANGYRTHYAHLSEIYIKNNTVIKRGMVIGRMGNTGLSNGEHLHYGIEKLNPETQEWELIDPINFLRGVSNGK